MLKQQYDAKSFLSVIKKDEIRKWKLWNKKKQAGPNAQKLADALKKQNYCINSLQIAAHKGKCVYLPGKAQDHFALKLVDCYLRRIYKIIQSDRGKIIRQISTLLEDEGKFTLMRFDIKDFYEAISFNNCIKKIKNDMILSPQGVSLISSLQKEYFKVSSSSKGVPRGIGLSTTLSELYLKHLDRFMAGNRDVIYYARYVDDIFVLADHEKIDCVKKIMTSKIKEIGLELNPLKNTTQNIFEKSSFQFLGYQFEVNIEDKKKNGIKTGEERVVSIQIAPEKVKKIKQRIIKSFLEYKKTGDFQLLLGRLRYLSCSKAIKKTENGVLYAGNAYNYCYVTDSASFKVFDGFLAKRMRDFCFTDKQEAKLKRISFFRAFKNKTVANFTRRQITTIKKVWIHEQ